MKDFDKLYSYLKINKTQLQEKGLEIEFEDNSFGDYTYQEDSRGFSFKINNNIYRVCWIKVTEDQEDWAQAESHTYDVCEENEKHIEPSKVLYLLENFQAIKRNNIINEILE